MKNFLLLIASFFIVDSFAQTNDTSKLNELESIIIDHSNINGLINSHKKIIKRSPFTEGYRIQIFNGNSREEAMKVKSEFYNKFPSIRCYTIYQQPYYKVRVGDYPNPESARNDLKLLGRYFPSSFLVPEKIRRLDNDDDKEEETKKKP
jgi:signal peptidase I